MDKLISRLNSMPNAYFEFIDTVVDYVKSREEHFITIMNYLDNNECATPSDVIEFISSQPDFFDDDAPIDADTLVS